MATKYKLRACVSGHKQDVRGVCATYFPEGGFASCSRDVTSRIWAPNEEDPNFREGIVFGGHTNFVSCICVTPPDDANPQGLVLTGSNDKNIHAYNLSSPEPLFKLEGHTNTVCAIAAGKFGMVISGSWDQTAIVWLLQKKSQVMKLKGHDAAVWAVASSSEGGYMLTGSADKTIKMWKAGRCCQTYVGHADCVRGLAVLNAESFLSCSNDNTIRRWLINGECAFIYQGHTNFVYSIAVLPNGNDFVSSGEDRCLKVWSDGECRQTIPHPTESVWSVCVLPNGDIVSGASDSLVRVFTRAPEREADEATQKMYEESVASSSIPAQLGDIPVDKLPGPDVLYAPGTRDGQRVMVKEANRITLHEWSSSDTKWVKLGDVTGAVDEETGSSKKMYKGKEYDYVFDVELSEGKPLKLPYNAGDDVWHVAHNWLAENQLDQMFLDQVAKFLMDQTKGVTLGTTNPALQYSDPFTGGSRYIPGSGPTQPAAGEGVHGADPFTGAGSYRPGYSSSTINTSRESYLFFPKTSPISFDSINTSAVIEKLKSFNSAVGDANVDESDFTLMESMLNGAEPTAQHIQLLWKILQWPIAQRFPSLDILRYMIRNQTVNDHFCNQKDGPEFLSFLMQSAEQNAPVANQMLGLRILTNMFKCPGGEKLLLNGCDSIVDSILQFAPSPNKNIQIGVASVLLNFAVSLQDTKEAEGKSKILNAVATTGSIIKEPEALFRLLVTAGTLISADKNCLAIARTLNLLKLVQKCKTINDPMKVCDCAKQLVSFF